LFGTLQPKVALPGKVAQGNGILVSSSGLTATVQIDTTLVAVKNANNQFSADQSPSTAGGNNLGSNSVPWGNVFVGSAGANKAANFDTSSLTTNRTVKIPDANTVTVQGATAGSHQFATAISGTTGAITFTQPAFTDISGTATSGQLPTDVVYNDASNTYSGTHTQDFSASTQTVKVPLKSTPGSPSVGEIWINTAAHWFRDNAGTPGNHLIVDVPQTSPPSSGYVPTSNGDGTYSWAAQSGSGGGYATIDGNGSSVTQRATVNFAGSGLIPVDNGGSTRTDVFFVSSAEMSLLGGGL